ncbi:hypothetical protein DFH28DRAFT_171718 [Melampsora americana]|nr:hypothetical protein DFH28DRAFT_171718 [Melampsora americana]
MTTSQSKSIQDTSLLPSDCSFLDFSLDSDQESTTIDQNIIPPSSSKSTKQFIWYHTNLKPTHQIIKHHPSLPFLSPTWKSERVLQSDHQSITSSSTSTKSSFTNLEYNTFKSPYLSLHHHLTRSTSSTLPHKRISSSSIIRSSSTTTTRPTSISPPSSISPHHHSCFTIPETTPFNSFHLTSTTTTPRQSTGKFTSPNLSEFKRSISYENERKISESNLVDSSESSRNLKNETNLKEEKDHRLVESEERVKGDLTRTESFKTCVESLVTEEEEEEIPITPLSIQFNPKELQEDQEEEENVSLKEKNRLMMCRCKNHQFKYDLILNWIESNSDFLLSNS